MYVIDDVIGKTSSLLAVYRTSCIAIEKKLPKLSPEKKDVAKIKNAGFNTLLLRI